VSRNAALCVEAVYKPINRDDIIAL
jgi:hypothetical protein